jgi:hypothetical protein
MADLATSLPMEVAVVGRKLTMAMVLTLAHEAAILDPNSTGGGGGKHEFG